MSRTPTMSEVHNVTMRYLNAIALLLVIVGGLNWLLVGIAQFDLVAAITGATFGETNLLSSIVYILVGLAALALVPALIRWTTGPEEPA
jgi:uncharacterized protein